MTQRTHYEQTLDLFRAVDRDVIAFGRSALIDLEEGKTIRQMSIDLCGNNGLEDRIGRWIQAAEWDRRIAKDKPVLYEEAREWLSASHFTLLEKIRNVTDDYEYARDLMEQCLVRRGMQVVEVKPVDWLRAKLRDPADPPPAVIYHRLFKIAAKALKDAQSELERAGLLATKTERRRVRLLSAVVRTFHAEAK